jgi:hypothetical protein
MYVVLRMLWFKLRNVSFQKGKNHFIHLCSNAVQSHLGGVIFSVFAIGPTGSTPSFGDGGSKALYRKNLRHIYASKAKFIIFLAKFLLICY